MSAEPQIIYSDDWLIVINKPALINSVSQSNGSLASIAQWLTEKYPGIEQASEEPLDGGLVNRLDFETSGILIAAKNRPSWLALKEQFSKREVDKTYIAIIEGSPALPLVIEAYIGNRYRGSKKVLVQSYPENRFQHTHSILRRTLSQDKSKKTSVVEIEAMTGARHQIRAHCASIGHPLVGDALYGSTQTLDIEGLPFALHALQISFVHPQNIKDVLFQAPAPEYFGLRDNVINYHS